MKVLLLFACFDACQFPLLSCLTDPMDMNYTHAEGMQSLISKTINPPIDERKMRSYQSKK
ncbi:hypothetical protein GO755_00375 [Spirosoma sp. HMF4905]|uniref:Uncharacterized protein n=1 Tax=Spirosoma arboris TaxID=2682092 RepID=A0A7K1S4D1_9BACT|nr:hypothetical protein [Spirosoma arboris]MVM28466.1 hypothetical protein [Spirosoma arboris]